jgi:hypothetical protein
MIILMTAALAAAQPATKPAPTPRVDAHAQHQQTGQMRMMSEKEMADCRKCCEEMMAKMHDGHAEHSEHEPK